MVDRPDPWSEHEPTADRGEPTPQFPLWAGREPAKPRQAHREQAGHGEQA